MKQSLLASAFFIILVGCEKSREKEGSPDRGGAADGEYRDQGKPEQQPAKPDAVAKREPEVETKNLPEETVTVLVAQKEIEWGTVFTKPRDWFKEKKLPRSQAPAKAVAEWSMVQDRLL